MKHSQEIGKRKKNSNGKGHCFILSISFFDPLSPLADYPFAIDFSSSTICFPCASTSECERDSKRELKVEQDNECEDDYESNTKHEGDHKCDSECKRDHERDNECKRRFKRDNKCERDRDPLRPRAGAPWTASAIILPTTFSSSPRPRLQL